MSEVNAAREAARRLYKRVSYSDGPLGSFELSSLLEDTYQHLKIPFKPNKNDIKLYEQVLDANRDGKVTLQDLQAKAIQYLTTNTLINSIKSGASASSRQSQPEPQQQILYNAPPPQQRYQQLSSTQAPPATSKYSQPETGIKYSEPQPQVKQTYNYQFKPSYNQNNNSEQRSLSTFTHETVQSFDRNQSTGRSGYESQNHPSERSFQQNEQNYVNQSYQPYSTEPQHHYEEEQYQDRPYSEAVREYLAVVGQVFMRYADQSEYVVTEEDVPDLLRDTYAVLGRQGYNPSRDDVQTWMKLCDVNQDGKVEFQEYEYFVVKSLERSGLDLYD